MPAPTKEKENGPSLSVIIVKASAPGLNVMESMVTSPLRNSTVIVEVLNVALSPAMTGGIPVFQFTPSFHTEFCGIAFQMEFTASAGAAMATTSRRAPRAVVKNP